MLALDIEAAATLVDVEAALVVELGAPCVKAPCVPTCAEPPSKCGRP